MRVAPLLRLVCAVALALTVHTPAFAQASGAEAPQDLPPFIPRLTDDDRKAAFPDVEGHTLHGNRLNYLVLADQLEWQGGDPNRVNVDTRGWIGTDRNRMWFRAEGNSDRGPFDDAQAHVFYGRQFSRWWDVVAGLRQDVGPGPAQTWAAIGLQGLAPYWFEVEATAYLGATGRTHVRVEVEYELLLTNRLILQPLLEAEIFGKADPGRLTGAGLTTTDIGVRLRYERRRQFAPYVGVTWNRKWGQTARLGEAAGGVRASTRLAAGVRLWL
jgi:copper resistance protein B